MVDFVFKADGSDRSVDWTDSGVWTGGIYPDSIDADITIPTTTILATGNPYVSYIALSSGTAIDARSLSMENNYLSIGGSLTVAQDVTIGNGAEINMIGGQLTAGTINSGGINIQGYGTINATHLVSSTQIVGNGLTINAATLDNDGEVAAASGTVHINTDAGGFSAISDGHLDSGTYLAGIGTGGAANSIYLNVGDVIDTLDTSVSLTNGATIYSYDDAAGDYVALQDSLHSIGTDGELSLAPGTYNFADLDVGGTLSMAPSQLSGVATTNLSGDVSVLAGGTIHGNGVIAAPLVNNGVVEADTHYFSGKSLVLDGAVSGQGILAIAPGNYFGSFGTLEVAEMQINGAVGEGQDVVFGNNMGRLTLADVYNFHGTLAPSTEGYIFSGAGDVVVLQNVSLQSITGVNYLGDGSGGTLTLTQGSGSIALKFDGQFTTSSFTLSAGDRTLSSDPESVRITIEAGVGTVPVPPICFVTGTMIRTVDGDVPVERLRVGDQALTASGQARPIRWIGHRALHGIGDASHADRWPIRVRTGAFGPDRPSRDLYLSPGHALCVTVLDDVFIPVDRLINDATIAPVALDQVDYWHVELDSHDVLLANDLPAESYMDAGNRHWFAGNDAAMEPARAQQSLADYARPFVDAGPVVDAVRARLAARARMMGWETSTDMDLHLMVDGRRVDGDRDGDLVRFIFPADARVVDMLSASFVPVQQGMGADDRQLGVAITALTVEDGLRARTDVPLDDPAFHALHPLEQDGDRQWRWTQGRVALPATLWADCRSHVMLRVGLLPGGGLRWIAPVDTVEVALSHDGADNVVRLRA